MGCVESTATVNQDLQKQYMANRNMFVVQGIIGTGGFGKVLVVTLQQTGKWYAVKEVNKVDLVKHKTGHAMIFSELEAMSRVEEHPFLVSLHLAYHDRHNIYLVLDLKNGGDLRYYLRNKMIFEERDVAFYVACISSALNHIHSRNMIHRDIKPENIILDERGWPHLADFGVAHVNTPENSAKFGGTLTSTLASGTKQYLAPEVFCKEHMHGPESDYWSLAVVAHELLFARRPFEKHCSVSFIYYLEGAIATRRELIRASRMTDLKHGRGLSFIPDGSECKSFSPTISPRGSIGSGAAFSPGVSASTSRESSGQFPFPGMTASRSCSMDEVDGRDGAGGRDSIVSGRESVSSMRDSTGGKESTSGYCSSVYITPVPTPHAKSGLRKGIAAWMSSNGGFFGAGTGANSSPTSRPVTPSQITTCMEVSAESTAHVDAPNRFSLRRSSETVNLTVRLPSTPVRQNTHHNGIPGSPAHKYAPSPRSRGIGIDHAESSLVRQTVLLPQLSVPTSPQRTAQNKQSWLAPLANPGSPVHLSQLMQQHAQQKAQFASRTSSASASSSSSDEDEAKMEVETEPGGFKRAPYGDHWAVDDDPILPGDLRVHIPHSTWVGPISLECSSFLKGMFDIRPSHRLSSRDIDAVRTHPWLLAHGLDNWVDLHHHRYNPHFKPGKSFMRETFSDPVNMMLGGEGNTLNGPDDPSNNIIYQAHIAPHPANGEYPDDSANGTGGVLTAEERASFRGFRYTSESFREFFRNQEPDAESSMAKDKGCGAAAATTVGGRNVYVQV